MIRCRTRWRARLSLAGSACVRFGQGSWRRARRSSAPCPSVGHWANRRAVARLVAFPTWVALFGPAFQGR